MLPRGYLIGGLTADPTPGITSTSLDYTRFSVACSENYTRANQTAKTHYYTCIAWGKRAQYISTYIKKGDNVFIEYTLLTNNYTNIEGRVVKRVDLQVEKIEMLYQKLNRAFDSGHMSLSTETNIEDRYLLKNQEDALIDNNISSLPELAEAKSEEETPQIDLELEDIYNMKKDTEE